MRNTPPRPIPKSDTWLFPSASALEVDTYKRSPLHVPDIHPLHISTCGCRQAFRDEWRRGSRVSVFPRPLPSFRYPGEEEDRRSSRFVGALSDRTIFKRPCVCTSGCPGLSVSLNRLLWFFLLRSPLCLCLFCARSNCPDFGRGGFV